MKSTRQIRDRLRKAGKTEDYIASYLRGWHQPGRRLASQRKATVSAGIVTEFRSKNNPDSG